MTSYRGQDIRVVIAGKEIAATDVSWSSSPPISEVDMPRSLTATEDWEGEAMILGLDGQPVRFGREALARNDPGPVSWALPRWSAPYGVFPLTAWCAATDLRDKYALFGAATGRWKETYWVNDDFPAGEPPVFGGNEGNVGGFIGYGSDGDIVVIGCPPGPGGPPWFNRNLGCACDICAAQSETIAAELSRWPECSLCGLEECDEDSCLDCGAMFCVEDFHACQGRPGEEG